MNRLAKFVLVVLVVDVVGLYYLLNRNDDEPQAGIAISSTTTTVLGDQGSTTTSSTTTSTVPTTTSSAAPRTTTTTPPTTTTTSQPTTTAPEPAAPALPSADPAAPPTEPFGVLSGRSIALRGSVPDAELAEGYRRSVASIPGVDAVSVEMTVDRRVTGRSLTLRLEPPFPPPLAAGASDPRYDALAELSRAALDALPGASLGLTGHTDDVGTESTNQSLSVALARLVVDRLAARGVAAERTIVRGAGESQPIADNATPEGRQANRRVEAAFEGIRPS